VRAGSVIRDELVPIGGVHGVPALPNGYAGRTEIMFRKRPDKMVGLGRMGRIWDGLGRIVGRIESEESPMFTGLGTMGRLKWGVR